jgi:ketosteroid isomerase-like protein
MSDFERHHVDNDDFVLTWTEARDLVQAVEDAFGAADLAAIANGFTEDAVARFADFPEMHGRA